MAKKIKFEPVEASFTLIGIASHLKDYRLCFFLNQKLNTTLCRKSDLVIPGDPDRSFSFYIYFNKDERRNYFLIANHHPEGKLLPGQRGIDYLLAVDDVLDTSKVADLVKKIQSAPHVLTAFPIELAKVRNVNTILEDIEIHMISLKK